jgi:hypothetical protein
MISNKGSINENTKEVPILINSRNENSENYCESKSVSSEEEDVERVNHFMRSMDIRNNLQNYHKLDDSNGRAQSVNQDVNTRNMKAFD